MSKYLDPTTDIAFKKVFGQQEHADITISFLNSILELPQGKRITEVIITQTTNLPELSDEKISFVDISCTDQEKKKYIIEMQVVNEGNFIERSQYYAAYTLVSQLKRKQPYKELMPVIFVGVVDFDLLPGTDFLSHHRILDSKTGAHSLQHLEFHFVQLSKFNKSVDQLSSIADKWLYFIKHAADQSSVPNQLKTPHEIAEAFHVLERGAWQTHELQAYMKEVDEHLGRKGMLEVAEQKGREEGRLEIARNLLSLGLDHTAIAQATGLSIDQIKALIKKS